MLLGFLLIAPAVCAGLICYCSGAFGRMDWLWVLPVGYLAGFVVALILDALFILIACQLIDTNKPQEHDSKFYRWLVHEIIELLVPLLPMKIHVQGLEKTPREDRILLVSNHLHEIDPALLLRYFRRHRLAFIAKQEVRHMPIVGKIMHKLLCPAVNRENDRQALKTILRCVELLQEDKVSVGVFPEGYIRPDRKLHHLRNGVFKIAQKTNVPIVVCTVRNTHHVIPKALHLKRTHVYLHLVAVIRPEEYAGMSTVELGNRIYELMAEDLGSENISEESINP